MTFRFSDDGKYAYRLGVGMRGFWMQVEPQPVGAVERRCAGPVGAFLNGVRLRHPDDPSREYEREVLPFAFWKVRASAAIERDLPPDDLLVQDYVLHEAWRAEEAG